MILLAASVSRADPTSTALALPESAGGPAGFERLEPAITGLKFSHVIPAARHLTNQMLLDGAGVALADVNGDGRLDIFFSAANAGSQLWRNEGGWRFQDVTDTAFPEKVSVLSGDLTGVAFTDLNADQAPDLILNSHADGIRVLLNNGQGAFASLVFQQSSARGGHSLALADVDGDGWVDIYVCNYRQRALMDMPSARATFQGSGAAKRVATLDGRPTTEPDLTNRFVVNAAGGLEELGEPDVLYRNFGGTNFAEVSWTGGAFLDEDGRPVSDPPRDWGLAAQFCDINGDGKPDLYVCNDFQTPDRLWFNEGTPGRIRFRAAPRETLRHTSLFSMGVDFADINRDDRWDFIVLDMLSPDHVRRLTMLDGTPSVLADPADPLARPQSDANTLFLQRRDGSFAEIAAFAQVTATDWSWTPAFLDVDLDGWPDLLVSAGQERGARDLDVAEHMKAFRRGGLRTDAQIFRERQKFPSQPAPLRAFRNQGTIADSGPPVFDDRSGEWGFDFNGVSHGMALADLDGDGDQDVVVNHLNVPAGLYRNISTAPRLSVRLNGRAPNTGALNSRLRFWWHPNSAKSAKPLPQSAQLFAGGRYLSSDGPTRTFACPGPGHGTLEVRWPSGLVTSWTNLTAGRLYQFNEPENATNAFARFEESEPSPLRFESKPTRLKSPGPMLDDFVTQPLLPRRQSPRFPALAFESRDGGGGVLWIGGCPGQPIRRVEISASTIGPVREFGPARTSAALALWAGTVFVAESAWDGAGTDHPLLFQLNLPAGSLEPLPSAVTAPSTLALSTNSPTLGALLFVGGGPIRGQYPRSSPSEVLHFDGTRFQSSLVTNLGLITGAVFADLDGDSKGDLAVVSEWGTPRIFRRTGQHLEGWDAPVTLPDSTRRKLSDLSGWWQSIAVADLDQDGQQDIVLGNWGLNSAQALLTGPPAPTGELTRPLVLYHGGELDAGPGGCLEAYTGTDGRLRPVHGLSGLGSRLPWLNTRFPTHRSFAEATIPEIFGDQLQNWGRLDCRWLSSLLLYNRGDHFEGRPLPPEAQLGPVRAMAVGDFDGDGSMDLFGVQGFFGHNFGVSRDDAGAGFFLFGRIGSQLESIPASDVGVKLLGEVGSVLAAELNGDGRTDLIVGEPGGPLTVLLNQAQ